MYSRFADYTLCRLFKRAFLFRKIFWTYDNIFCGCDDDAIQFVVRDTATIHKKL